MKKKVPYIIIYLVFIVVFNVVFFLFKPEECYAAIWISYSFIHLAYAAVIITQVVDNSDKEITLKLSSYLISVIYFVVTLIIGIVFILINPEGYKLALSSQIVLLGAYLILLISNLITNKKIVESLEEPDLNRNYVKGVTAVIKAILIDECDEAIITKLNHLYDIVHSSQIRSNADAMKIESEIENRILVLERNISVMDITDQIMEIEQLISLAKKRNILIKRCN